MLAIVSKSKSPGGFSGCGKRLPVETWMASAPTRSHQRQTSMVSASVLPFLSQGMTLLWSMPLSLTWRWKPEPTRARIAWMMSSRKRARFSSGPP